MSSLREQFDIEADGVPSLGDIDAALAMVASENRTRRRIGLAAVAAAAAFLLLVLGVRPILSTHDPVVGPRTTSTPTPTPTPTLTASGSPLSASGPVVVGDSANGRSYAVFTVRNTSDRPVVIGFVSFGLVYVAANGVWAQLMVLTPAGADKLIAVPPDERNAAVYATGSQFEPRGTTLNPGDAFAAVVTFTLQCGDSPPPTFTPRDSSGDPVIEVFGPSTGNVGHVILQIFATADGWVTTAKRAACPS